MPDVFTGWGWSQTVLQDRTGDWWIATDHGLFRFTNLETIDDVSRTSPSAIYTTRDGLAAPQVFRLFEDSSGDVWIGTVGGARAGLSRWQRRTRTFQHYTDADGLPRLDQSYVASFAEDRAGDVWIGFGGLGGLARHQDGRFVRFTTADGGPAGRISNLLLDSKGRLWAATRSVRRLPDRRPGRRAAHVRGLHHGAGPVQQYGSLRGRRLVGAHLRRDRSRHRPHRSGKRADPTLSQRRWGPTGALAAVRDRHGSLWFTAASGVVRLVPEIDAPQRPPPILITALHVGGRPQPISAIGEPEMRLTEPSLRNTHVQIDFVSLGFSHGQQLRYQYMLEGAERTWSPPSTQRTVNYASLASGSYRFRCAPSIRTRSSAKRRPPCRSRRARPIWRRWWFIMLAGLALAGAAYMVATAARVIASAGSGADADGHRHRSARRHRRESVADRHPERGGAAAGGARDAIAGGHSLASLPASRASRSPA